MGWGKYRVLRRLAATLALCGVLVHAGLLPWHTVSRFLAGIATDGLAADLMVICHGDGRPANAGNAVDDLPVPPATPQTHCPICKGLASFHHALLAAAQLGISARRTAGFEPPPRVESVATAHRLAPRSRGPPLPV